MGFVGDWLETISNDSRSRIRNRIRLQTLANLNLLVT